MVFGGYNKVSSTEIFVNNAWNILPEVPHPVGAYGLQGLTLRNEVYAIGSITIYSIYTYTIYIYINIYYII